MKESKNIFYHSLLNKGALHVNEGHLSEAYGLSLWVGGIEIEIMWLLLYGIGYESMK